MDRRGREARRAETNLRDKAFAMSASRLAKIGDAFAELLWPTRCVGCDYPDELICGECRSTLPWIAQRWACPACGAPYGWLTCTECHREWEPRATVCAFSFEGLAARLPPTLKDHHELRLAPVIAAAMATALDEASSWPARDGRPRFDPSAIDAVTFVPATAAAFRRRGFDHMELVSRALARELDLPFADVLVRPDALDQRGLSKEDRAANLAGTIHTIEDVSDLRILLVDDVITTGASMREATRALLARGAAEVTAGALCRVW
jgi:ComF family protein